MIHWKVDFVLRVILKLSVNEALILKGSFDEQYNFLKWYPDNYYEIPLTNWGLFNICICSFESVGPTSNCR